MAAVVTNMPDPNINYDAKECAGCRGSVEDGDGVVVAFGNSLWHIDCFNCAKCGKRVSADNNILLLSDGSPMCTSCSYNCAVCKKPISHEAIMTGDESYHASCFACRQCRRHIGELVFAKTSQGIYCMACHNERVARSKRHRIKREQMAREKDKGIKEQSSFLRTTTPEPPGTPSNTHSAAANVASTPDPSTAVNRSAKRVSRQFASLKTYSDLVNAPPLPLDPRAGKSAVTPPPPSPTITTTHASPPSNHANGSTKQDRDSLQLPPSLQPGRRPSDEQPRPEPGPSSRPGSSSGAGRPEVSSPNRLSPTSDGHHRHSFGSASQPSERTPRSRSPSPSPSPSFGNGSRSPRAQSPMPDLTTPQRPGYQRSASSMDNHHGHAMNAQIEKLAAAPPRSHSLPASQEGQPQQQRQPVVSSPLATSPGPMSDSGRRSPHTPNGPSIFAQQQSAGLARAGTPRHDLPSLPQEVDEDDGRSSEPFTEEEEEEEEEEEDSRESEEQEEKPALPPIEFGGDESGFDDLLMFGTAEEKERRAKEREERRESARSEASFLSSTAVSSSSRPTSGSSSLASPISSTTKASKRNSRSPLPLNLLPSRSASLRKQPPVLSPRKPDPEAIVMSDTFDVDMARDTDESESSNAASSPVLTPQTFDLASYYGDERERSLKRPGSAGTGNRELSVKSTGRARSNSTTALTPTSTVTLIPTTPTPARSVSSPMVSTPRSSDANVDLTRSTSAASTSSSRKMDTSELVLKRLRSALDEAVENGAGSVKIDREFLEVVYVAVLHAREREREGSDADVQGKHYLHNLTVAQEQYDAELRARREAEAEVTRLKVQLSGQAARLTELSAGERKRDAAEQMSKDYSESLHGLERDLSKLKAERELMAAEVEELVGVKKGTQPPAEQTLQRSLTKRFDNLKSQYKKELEPLVQQRERLLREINELKEERNICLEQTTALTARNEELAALIAQMSRQVESAPVITSQAPTPGPAPAANHALNSSTLGRRQISGPITVIQGPSTPNPKAHGPLPALPSSLLQTPSTTLGEEHDNKATLSSRKLFVKGGKEVARLQEKESAGSPPEKDGKHNFQLSTLLRVARCDHCGDKMWGTQLRCTLCHIGLHNRCHALFSSTCTGEPRAREATPSPAPLQPSMFGRDLIEQVRADSAKEHRDIPIIVEKCITAVEQLAMDYEGIYRKTGGSSESKAITALFERGNCENIDLINCDVYTDISSVTSVLKTYFRQLPNPLLTHALHEAFVGAASQRDPQSKSQSLSSLIFQLPSEHFHTLRYLMLHLNRVQQRADENLMNARNLGVVFGPTLMRSSDPNREFADMAGKALAIEWLIENAPSIFRDLGDS